MDLDGIYDLQCVWIINLMLARWTSSIGIQQYSVTKYDELLVSVLQTNLSRMRVFQRQE